MEGNMQIQIHSTIDIVGERFSCEREALGAKHDLKRKFEEKGYVMAEPAVRSNPKSLTMQHPETGDRVVIFMTTID
jgi:hypothetical protein